MPDDDDIANLIARTALADRTAFRALYSASSEKLFGTLLRILKNRSDAEDALQDVYVKIWRRAGSYRADRAAGMTWLISIARNHAIDRLRTARPERTGLDFADEIADTAATPEQATLAGDQRRVIDLCLGELAPEHASAVRAAYIEGFSYAELAGHFDINLNTMRTWLRRSLLKLRECLER
ncbi:MAG: sigma-70 family RNA polymerase sigma factor [Rhodobacteraceae bacterium]|nr:sigma-70 family RNA polymerase sigma factor [Paracoccaceae bacterium]